MSAQTAIQVFLSVLGGLGIFLLGMKNMSEGIQAVAGARLRRLIASVTDNRLMAVLVGTAVTSLIQSSSVTTVMVVGLVNSGFMTLMQAIGVILGANIGTTITGWILTLKVGKYGLPLLGLAALVYLFSRRDRVRYTALVWLGIGMIFFGLELMSEGLKPLRDEPQVLAALSAFKATSYGGVLKCVMAGCIVTMIVQSSSAMVGVTMSLAKLGIIDFSTAAALVLGENIGTTITAILAAIGATTNARRAALAHTFFNILGVLWITAVFRYYLKFILILLPVDPAVSVMEQGVAIYPNVMPAIALVHSVFNVANTIVFLPLLPLLAALVTKLVPARGGEETPRLEFLDVRMLDTPALNIEQSRRELQFMADSNAMMLARLKQAVASEQRDEQNEQKIFRREEIMDNVQKEVTLFLSHLLAGNVPLEVADEGRRQLRVAHELEAVSDYIVNVLKVSLKLHKAGLTISEEGRRELVELNELGMQYMELIRDGLKGSINSADLMSRARSEGELITRKMKEFRQNHLDRLVAGEAPALSSMLFLDMLSAYRRIKDHLFNVAEALDLTVAG